MRVSVTAFVVAGALVGTAFAGSPAGASQGAPVCSFVHPPKYNKVVNVRKGGVHLADRKRPSGWLSARRTVVKTTEEGNQWFKPYGKAKVFPLAKKNVLCVVGSKNGQIVMKRTNLRGFRKAINAVGGSSVALKVNKQGRTTLAYQVFEA